MLEKYLSWEIEGLGAFGFLHLLFVALTILGCFYITKIADGHTEKDVTKVVFIIGIIFLLLETYKQLFHNDIGDGLREYSWGYFPYQLCSTPMYLCLLTPVFKKEFRKTVYSFLAFYGFIAGLTVMVIADTVIVDEVTISIQSLFWHGMQCVLGCYLIKTQGFGKSYKEVFPGILLFIVLVVIAIILNFTFEQCKIHFGLTDSFNMFYISPYYESHVLILSDVWKATNYHFALLFYLVGVTTGAFFINYMAHLYLKIKSHQLKVKEA